MKQGHETKLSSIESELADVKSKMEESEAQFNIQLVSLTENLNLNKADLTATQEKLMDVVKHNDELRGLNLGSYYKNLCYIYLLLHINVLLLCAFTPRTGSQVRSK